MICGLKHVSLMTTVDVIDTKLLLFILWYLQGYCMTHGPTPEGNNKNMWPQSVMNDVLTLGGHAYTADQLLAILRASVSVCAL